VPRDATLINGIEGEPVAELTGIEENRSVEALKRLLEFGVHPQAADKLREFIGRIQGGLTPRIFVHPVRSRKVPYAVGWDDVDRPWSRVGNIYVYALAGQMIGSALMPVPAGEEDTLMVFCCLAA
jgi:hypothetical protein